LANASSKCPESSGYTPAPGKGRAGFKVVAMLAR
jgi:hypothetical protein